MRRTFIPILWLLGASFIVWSGTKNPDVTITDGFFLPVTYPWLAVLKLLGTLSGEALFLQICLRPGRPKKSAAGLWCAVVAFLGLSLFFFYGALGGSPEKVAHATWVVFVAVLLLMMLLFKPVTDKLFPQPVTEEKR